MASDREVGKAFITLRADDSRLRGDIDAVKNRITNAVGDINRSSKITPQVDASRIDIINRRLADLKSALGLVDQQKVTPQANLSGDATAKLEGVEQAAQRVDKARPNVRVAADTAGAESGLDRVLQIATKLALTVGTGFLLNGLKNASQAIGTFAVQAVASFEQTKVAFTGLFQSAPIANQFLGQLQDFAAKTPYEFDQLTGSAQRLLGTFGRGFRQELIPTLTAVGDVAASLGQAPAAVDRVILAISQIQGKGRVQLEELNQIREALPGFNAVAAIAEGLGLTVQETTAKIASGSLEANTAITALISGMREFPGAAGAMDRQSQTLNGRISTLKDNVKILARESFEPLALSVGSVVDQFGQAALSGGPLEGVFKTVNDALTKIVTNAGPQLVPLIVAIGDGFGRLLTVLQPLIARALPILTRLIDPLVTVLETVLTVIEAGAPIIEPFVTIIEALGVVIGAIPVGVIEALTYALIAYQVGTIAATLASVGLGTAVVAMGGELAAGAAVASSALGPLTILLGAATAAYLLFHDEGPSEQQKRFTEATDKVTDSVKASVTALVADSDALRKIVEDGSAATETATILSTALAKLRDIQIAPPEGRGGVADILSALTLGTFAPDVAGGIGKLASVDDALNAIGVSADKLVPFLERVKAGGTDFTDIFPTKQQADDAVFAFRAFKNGQEAAFTGTKDVTNIVEAFNTLKVAGVTTDATFQALGLGIRSSIDAVAAADPIAAGVLDSFDRSFQAVGLTFGTSSEQLNVFLTTLAQATDLAADTRTTDFTALAVAVGSLATPSERASTALKAINEELDKLNGKKISLREATSAVEELIDKLDGKDSVFTKERKIGVSFDPQFAVGRSNQAALAQAIGLFTAEAQAIYDESGDPLVAEATFNTRIDVLREDFVKAGGTIEAFNEALASGAYGSNEIQFQTVLDKQTAIAMTAQVTELAKQSPKIAAIIQTDVDEGRLADAQAKLDALVQAEQGGFFPEITPEMDPEATAVAEARILELLSQVTATQTLTVVLEADASKFERTMRNLRVSIGSVSVFEAGGILRRFEAGGLLQSMAPHLVTAGEANRGPFYAYGEPSTQGEAFISMAPKWRDRSLAIWRQTGDMLGVRAPATTTTMPDLGPLVQRVDAMTRKLGKVAQAVASMPPITVQAVGGSPENAAAKIWWLNKARLADKS